MSGWDAYIKTLFEYASCIKKGAIIGTDGSVWAKSNGTIGENFEITQEETQKLAELFNNLDNAPSVGFKLEGEKFIVPRVEENILFGKKGKDGIWAAKTKQAILIAFYSGEGLEGQDCRKAVEKLAEYLQSQGY